MMAFAWGGILESYKEWQNTMDDPLKCFHKKLDAEALSPNQQSSLEDVKSCRITLTGCWQKQQLDLTGEKKEASQLACKIIGIKAGGPQQAWLLSVGAGVSWNVSKRRQFHMQLKDSRCISQPDANCEWVSGRCWRKTEL